jgi:hypothetical protein
MVWEEELFAFLDDPELEAGALYDADRAPELADRERAEYQQVPLAGRLAASLDREVTLYVTGVGPLAGRLERVAHGWCLLAGAGQDWIVRLAAVAAVDGASDRAVPEVAWSPVARLGLGSPLRRLADTASRCVVHRLDAGRHEGTLRRVGQDFAEVLEGEPPRVTLVAFAAIAAVQSRDA